MRDWLDYKCNDIVLGSERRAGQTPLRHPAQMPPNLLRPLVRQAYERRQALRRLAGEPPLTHAALAELTGMHRSTVTESLSDSDPYDLSGPTAATLLRALGYELALVPTGALASADGGDADETPGAD